MVVIRFVEMKKAYSFRLSDEAIAAIRIAQVEGGYRSEAAVVEAWAVGRAAAPVSMGISRPVESIEAGGVAPRLGTKEERLEAARKALAGASVAVVEPVVEAGPEFPFRAQVGDDVWTIWQKGSRYGYEIEDKGTGGHLTQLMVGKLWEQRIL